MALTDDEAAALRSIAAQLTREDRQLAASLSTFTVPAPSGRGFLIGMLGVVAVLLLLAAVLGNPAALVLAVTYAALLPLGVRIIRRRRL